MAEWRKELKPGTTADKALAYLLTHGFDCQLTRGSVGEITRILATQRQPAPGEPVWQIDLAIADDEIQSVQIVPTALP